MLSLAIAIALGTGLSPAPKHTVTVDVIRGSDTLTASLVLEEGILGTVAFQVANTVTVVRAMIRQSPTVGCLRVDVGSGTGPTGEVARTSGMTPSATVALCGVSSGRITSKDGPTYRVTVGAPPPVR